MDLLKNSSPATLRTCGRLAAHLKEADKEFTRMDIESMMTGDLRMVCGSGHVIEAAADSVVGCCHDRQSTTVASCVARVASRMQDKISCQGD